MLTLGSRWLLPVTDQHVAARGRELWTVFPKASQDGKIALINQFAAETLHIRCARPLLLIRATVSEGGSQNRDTQQEKRDQEFVHFVDSSKLQTDPATIEPPFPPSPSRGRPRQRSGHCAAAGQGASQRARGSS